MKILASLVVVLLPFTSYAFHGDTLLNAPHRDACRDFVDFATQRKLDPRYISNERSPLLPFNTDSIVVYQNGKPVYKWYDGVASPIEPHIMWSASKMLIATLLERTIQTGQRYQGEYVTLDMKVASFYPDPYFLKLHPGQRELYEKMTLRNLVEMTANFDWKEYYDGNLSDSSFFPMLYNEGVNDTAQFALKTRLHSEGPGGRWNYSGGNMNILSGILKKIHGARYETMPWTLLFDPLGITGARIERDKSGQFIGSSYFYLNADELARVGQLYLQDGYWNGKRLLSADWVHAAQVVSPGLARTATDLETIKKLGTQSGRIFWLNTPVYRADGRFIEEGTDRQVLYPMEMPEAPSDMYFAAGHYGQLLIVIPSENMVIARTGYDLKYWDHIQPLTVKAVSCFNPKYKPNPVADLTPPSAGAKTTAVENIFSTLGTAPSLLGSVAWALDYNLVAKVIAKEMCSFLYVSEAPQTTRLKGRELLDLYLNRSGLPETIRSLLTVGMNVDVNWSERAVEVSRLRVNLFSPIQTVKAKLESDLHFGCQLVKY